MNNYRRFNYEINNNELYICYGNHDKGSPCEYQQLNISDILTHIESLTKYLINIELELQIEKTHTLILQKIITHIYNTGYNNGHNDTIESCYVPILPCDMNTINSDIVSELVQTLEEEFTK